MKKLTKQNLDELAATMNIVPAEEQLGYVGAYSNDCYWRCIAFIKEGTNDPAIAEIYALSYFKRIHSDGADAYLQQYGSGVTAKDMQANKFLALSDGYGFESSDPDGWYIGYFNVSNISGFSGSGGHAVVIKSENSDGSLNYYDPQNGGHGSIAASEVGHISRALY